MREIKFRLFTSLGMRPIDAYDRVSQLRSDPDDFWYVMQYTGLKDKNGTEIYEGDIVESGPFRWEIIFHEEGMFCARGGGLRKRDTIPYLQRQCSKAGRPMVVIGNIHENPELVGE